MIPRVRGFEQRPDDKHVAMHPTEDNYRDLTGEYVGLQLNTGEIISGYLGTFDKDHITLYQTPKGDNPAIISAGGPYLLFEKEDPVGRFEALFTLEKKADGFLDTSQ